MQAESGAALRRLRLAPPLLAAQAFRAVRFAGAAGENGTTRQEIREYAPDA